MLMSELNADPVFYVSFLMVLLAIVSFVIFIVGRRFKSFRK